MADNNQLPQMDPQEQKSSKPELVGVILQKERITRRINLETIAKDLKLNVAYIKAIESNNYVDLPAEPYIRVYLKSIAEYLMLDQDAILKKFFAERGLNSANDSHDNSNRIRIDVEKDSGTRSNTTIIVVLAILSLVAISYLANQAGWMGTGSNEQNLADDAHINSDSVVESENSNEYDSNTSTANSTSDESLSDNVINTDTTSVKQVILPQNNEMAGNIRLVVTATVDSVWAQFFSDGVSWKNFLREGESKVFLAEDSINAHVGDNSKLRYTFNGKTLTVSGVGMRIFKLKKDGLVKPWKIAHWKQVFADRL